MREQLSVHACPRILLAVISFFAMLVSAGAKADDPLRLPGDKTFLQFQSTLTEIKASAHAAAVQQETAEAERLLTEGRLWVAAGRLRKAGIAADKLDLTIALIQIRLKNAEQKALAEEAERQTVALTMQLEELKTRWNRLIADRQRPAAPVGTELPTELPDVGDAP